MNLTGFDDEEKLLLDKWFLIRNIGSGTQDSYQRALKEYKKLLDRNLSELLQEAKDENHSQIEIMDRKITLNLLRFKKYLRESGKAPGTINQQYSAVVSFYKSFQITFTHNKDGQGILAWKKIWVNGWTEKISKDW